MTLIMFSGPVRISPRHSTMYPRVGQASLFLKRLPFFLISIGGSVLTNLASLGMALVILYVFLKICKTYNFQHSSILALTLLVHPYFWVNATCTMDYMFALGFSFLGFLQLLRGRYFTAGVAMALGIGSRLTLALVVGVFLLWFLYQNRQKWRHILQTLLAAGVFTILFYLPPADFAEWNTRFLQATVGGAEYWSMYLRLGRFVYKNIYFWSPLAVFVLVWGSIRLIRGWKELSSPLYKGLPWVAAIIILGMEMFYMGIPTEPTYLLPTLPFWLLLLSIAFRKKRAVLLVLLALIFLSNFVTFNVARPNVTDKATGAQYGLWVEPGYLVTDVQKRLEYMECGYQPCEWLEGDLLTSEPLN